MRITSSIEIRNTPEVVFSWLESPEKAMEWMTSVTGGEILHETPDRIGTTFREIVEDENGSIEMHGMITGFEANHSIAFHIESRVNIVDVEYRVKEISEGTRLAYYAEIRWKFPVNVISIFMGNKMKQNITSQLADELKKLKSLCEGDTSQK